MYMTKAPHDSVTRFDPTQAYGGYTLFAPHGGTDAWLIDMEGRICHRWGLDSTPGSGLTLLPNGNLLVLDQYSIQVIVLEQYEVLFCHYIQL